MEITCIGHSGFLVEIGEYNLIFDYYTDEKNVITPEMFEGKKTCVFVSHNHHDHYNRIIFEWRKFVSDDFKSEPHGLEPCSPANPGNIVYILENDCPAKEEVLRIGEGDEISVFDGAVHVKAYGSTDEGVSFLVRVGGFTIFHAGDLNDWYWEDELSAEELEEWEENYLKIIRALAGAQIDVAFMPEDPRLGVHARRGIEHFERIVGAGKIVPMHFPGNAGAIDYIIK